MVRTLMTAYGIGSRAWGTVLNGNLGAVVGGEGWGDGSQLLTIDPTCALQHPGPMTCKQTPGRGCASTTRSLLQAARVSNP